VTWWLTIDELNMLSLLFHWIHTKT
jgi:hypothetical protein